MIAIRVSQHISIRRPRRRTARNNILSGLRQLLFTAASVERFRHEVIARRPGSRTRQERDLPAIRRPDRIVIITFSCEPRQGVSSDLINDDVTTLLFHPECDLVARRRKSGVAVVLGHQRQSLAYTIAIDKYDC